MGPLRKYRNYLLALVLVLILVTAIQMSGFEREKLTRGEHIIRNMLAPLQGGVTKVTEGISGFFDAFFAFDRIQAQNKSLQEQVGELEREINNLKEYRQENIRLRKMLELKQVAGEYYELKAARVIARDPKNWYHTVTISKGIGQGIKKDMPVINSRGLIGRVINVTESTAEVLLILDQEGAVGSLVQETRVPGVVEGLGPRTDELEMIHLAHDAVVRKSNTIITSGLGGVFPKGLRIGYVKAVALEANGLMKRAIVQPFVDFDSLEEVMVVTGVEL